MNFSRIWLIMALSLTTSMRRTKPSLLETSSCGSRKSSKLRRVKKSRTGLWSQLLNRPRLRTNRVVLPLTRRNLRKSIRPNKLIKNLTKSHLRNRIKLSQSNHNRCLKRNLMLSPKLKLIINQNKPINFPYIHIWNRNFWRKPRNKQPSS